MPIRSGIGIGEAQVFNTSGLANQYARQVAIDQASLQKQALLNQKRNDDYLKELATTISSAKTLGNGLHPQDAEAIIGYQDKFKELYEKAATAKTDKERKILQAEVESGFQKANAYVNGAKMFRSNLDAVVRQITDHPYDFTDEQKKEVQKVYNAPYNQALTDGTSGINVLTYKRTPDFSEITKSIKSLDGIAEDLSVNSPKRRFAIPITGQNIQDSSQYMAEIDPKSLFDNSLLLIQGNNKLKSSLKSEYEIKNPNATEVPDDNQLASMLVGKYEEHKGGKDKAYIVGGTVFKNPKEPTTPQSEIKQAKLINDRIGSIKSLIENKDQPTFLALKSSLPSNSSMKWLMTNGKVVGIKFTVPKSYDEFGEPISAIDQTIDFTKGDPYKSINTIMNRYYGKKISNENLQGAGIGGNLSIPTHTRQEFKSNGWSDAEIAEAVRLGRIKVK